MGAKDPKELKSLLWKVSVFVFPSLSEGQGVALLEAMASGLASVASAIPSVKEIDPEGKAILLVTPGDCLIGPRRALIGYVLVSYAPNLFCPIIFSLIGGIIMKICFLGGARYNRPLDATSEKKWRLLAVLGEIFVIGFSQNLRPRRFTQHAHFYLFPKFPWPVLRYLAMFTVGPVLAFWLILRHGVRVLVAQSPYEGFAAAMAKLLAHEFRRRTVLIVESHGDFEVSLFLQRRVHWLGLYRWLMQRTANFSLRHADLFRAVSHSTRQQLETWAPGKPVVQFPAWTDMEAFLEAGDRDSPREPVVLYAGVLTPCKGVHHLLRAFAEIALEFPEARLEIAGQEENWDYAEKLRREVDELGLDERVSFVGEIPQVQLAELMRRAYVFVLPSLSEGLPRVVLEAMATGTPVVGSRVSGIPEIVQEGVTGFLIPPGDEKALAERLRWILSHPEKAQDMGKRARAFAQSFFSTQAYMEGYRRLFAMAMKILEGDEINCETTSF